MARSKKVDAVDAQRRHAKVGAKDAQSGPTEAVRHQEPETADEGQSEAVVPQDDANDAESTQPVAQTPGEGVAAGGESVGAAEMVPETETVGVTAEPKDAQTTQPEGDTAKSPGATLDTDAALALKRFANDPKCACGCGQKLSDPKKVFRIGHDGKLKKILRAVLRNELPLEAVPTEAVLRHREIRFIMAGPEYRRLVEVWQKAV